MICPVDKKDMIVVEHKNIELDHCLYCNGVWFDSNELELLLRCVGLDTPELLLSHILDQPESESKEKQRRCPICRRKMKKTSVGDKPKIVIDACVRRDGLWFDGGEVAQLVKELARKKPPHKEAQQQMLAFLAETFKAKA